LTEDSFEGTHAQHCQHHFAEAAMNFVRLTDSRGDVFVNPDMIRMLLPLGEDRTTVRFDAAHEHIVHGATNEIADKLRAG
jgi:hypothetical protein